MKHPCTVSGIELLKRLEKETSVKWSDGTKPMHHNSDAEVVIYNAYVGVLQLETAYTTVRLAERREIVSENDFISLVKEKHPLITPNNGEWWMVQHIKTGADIVRLYSDC